MSVLAETNRPQGYGAAHFETEADSAAEPAPETESGPECALDAEDDDIQVPVLGPIVPLKQQLELDKEDESLRKWKEQLLGSIEMEHATNLEPQVELLSLTIVCEGRPDITLPLPFKLNHKGHAFALKEGSCYRLKFEFFVKHNIVSGLTYKNMVWKNGFRVDNTRTMLGTFGPQQEPYVYLSEEETTPSGILARGAYSARTKFVDDDKRCYLELNYSFEIRKEWISSSSCA